MDDFAEFTTLSFDCYGTLIDWESGIAAALRPWAAAAGLALDDEALIAAHARHETHAQQDDPTALYPAVLEETLRRIGRELGAAVSEADAAAYGASVGEWPAFADAAEALHALSERFRLVILSNVDRKSLATSNRRLGTIGACDARCARPQIPASSTVDLPKTGRPCVGAGHVSAAATDSRPSNEHRSWS